jgi:hypothetical protein
MALKQYEELAVLEEGDDGAIVSIRGQGSPSVLLSAAYVGHLELTVKTAQVELTEVSPQQFTALRLLCAEVNTLVVQHKDTCNKYDGEPGTAQLLAVAMEELEEMRKVINALPYSPS